MVRDVATALDELGVPYSIVHELSLHPTAAAAAGSAGLAARPPRRRGRRPIPTRSRLSRRDGTPPPISDVAAASEAAAPPHALLCPPAGGRGRLRMSCICVRPPGQKGPAARNARSGEVIGQCQFYTTKIAWTQNR